jgi:hypothetical protein
MVIKTTRKVNTRGAFLRRTEFNTPSAPKKRADKRHTFTTRELEALKLDYLTRGIERGKTAMRSDTVFDLYLQRSDPADDDGYQRAAMLGTGVALPAPGVLSWRWWAVVAPGREVSLGDAAVMTLEQALARYLELLPLDTLKLIGGDAD